MPATRRSVGPGGDAMAAAAALESMMVDLGAFKRKHTAQNRELIANNAFHMVQSEELQKQLLERDAQLLDLQIQNTRLQAQLHDAQRALASIHQAADTIAQALAGLPAAPTASAQADADPSPHISLEGRLLPGGVRQAIIPLPTLDTLTEASSEEAASPTARTLSNGVAEASCPDPGIELDASLDMDVDLSSLSYLDEAIHRAAPSGAAHPARTSDGTLGPAPRPACTSNLDLDSGAPRTPSPPLPARSRKRKLAAPSDSPPRRSARHSTSPNLEPELGRGLDRAPVTAEGPGTPVPKVRRLSRSTTLDPGPQSQREGRRPASPSPSPGQPAAAPPPVRTGGEAVGGTRSLRSRSSVRVNYALPKLNTKMRKPDEAGAHSPARSTGSASARTSRSSGPRSRSSGARSRKASSSELSGRERERGRGKENAPVSTAQGGSSAESDDAALTALLGQSVQGVIPQPEMPLLDTGPGGRAACAAPHAVGKAPVEQGGEKPPRKVLVNSTGSIGGTGAADLSVLLGGAPPESPSKYEPALLAPPASAAAPSKAAAMQKRPLPGDVSRD